jgi:hypothetical protein
MIQSAFNAPLQAAFQAETMHFWHDGPTNVDPELQFVVPLLNRVMLLDRRHTIREAKKWIKEKSRGSRRPIIIVFEGPWGDSPHEFVRRLAEHDLRDGIFPGCNFLGLIDWPRKEFDYFFEDLAVKLGLPLNSIQFLRRRPDYKRAFEAHIKGRKDTIVFWHSVSGDNWTATRLTSLING